MSEPTISKAAIRAITSPKTWRIVRRLSLFLFAVFAVLAVFSVLAGASISAGVHYLSEMTALVLFSTPVVAFGFQTYTIYKEARHAWYVYKRTRRIARRMSRRIV